MELPGQGLAWQDLVSRPRPMQSLPPKAGRGFVHERSRSCVPVPQVTEHGVQGFHWLHSPSTVNYSEKDLLSIRKESAKVLNMDKSVHLETTALPGQGMAWHDLLSRLIPTQSFPPKAGRGSVHVRSRSCVPVPHVTEHGVQSFQPLHSPSTVPKKSFLKIKNLEKLVIRGSHRWNLKLDDWSLNKRRSEWF